MKDFLTTFAIVLVLLYVFLFFGGVMLLEHFLFSVALAAFIIALLIHCLVRQSEKTDVLEKRIEALESKKNGAD